MPERPKAKETDTEDSDAGNAGSGGLKPEECRNRNHQAGCGKDMADTKKKKKRTSPFLIILLLIALGTFFYSGYKLLTIHLAYKAGVDEYNSIEEAYTVSPAEAEDGTEDDLTGEEKDLLKQKIDEMKAQGMVFEDAEPPLKVDFDDLRKENPEIVGWLYVDAFPETISYPILRGEDNDYYLHHTFRKTYLFAGSIFENCDNSADFTDPHTIIYGHNMKNRSMFGNLKFLKEQERYDKNPYFWILTPQGNYRYKIFAAFDTPVSSSVYTLFSGGGEEFLAWEKEQKERSAVKNDIALRADDYTVTLSTCTSDSSVRCVVIGKCVSSIRPDTYRFLKDRGRTASVQ